MSDTAQQPLLESSRQCPVTSACTANWFLYSVIALLVLVVRWPTISQDLPFFYQEDEAHHFNRVAMMVAEGRFDPEYFHKPSLHFYLRMPVHAASFLVGVKKGSLRRIEEIEYRNRSGLGGWAFSASHPHTVKWQRAFSLLMALGAVLMVMATVQLLGGGRFGALAAGTLLAMSPALYERSAIVGVDTPMALFAMASIYFAVRFVRIPTLTYLFSSAVFAGLAVSTKYNALPIVLTPLLACLLSERQRTTNIVLVICIFTLTFFAASPFILSSLPLFLNHFAYEIWHYGVAGHGGHMAEPGISQVIHYLRYFSFEGVGFVALVLAIVGMFVGARQTPKAALVALSFPALFFVLMVMQKTNFERNMDVALLPLAVFVGVAIGALHRTLRSGVLVGVVILLALTLQPGLSVVEARLSRVQPESRNDLLRYLEQHPKSETGRIAASARLWLPKNPQRYERLDFQTIGVTEILQRGFSMIACMPHEEICQSLEHAPHFGPVLQVSATDHEQRIVKNPSLRLFNFTHYIWAQRPEATANFLKLADELTLSGDAAHCQSRAEHGAAEGYCWLTTKMSRMNIDDGAGAKIELMSPWNQEIFLRHGLSGTHHRVNLIAGQWSALSLEHSGEWLVFPEKVARAPGRDNRELGVAIRVAR